MIKNTKKIIAISIDKKILKELDSMPLNKSKLINGLLEKWIESNKQIIGK